MMLPTVGELVALRGAAKAASLRARGRVDSQRVGPHRGTRRGRGLEFEEVRAYVPGDDLRSIHWRVTARRGRTHTKLFREERERPVWLLVDLEPQMFFGSRLQLKSVVAVRAAALLAWIAMLEGERVGAVISGGTGVSCRSPRARDAGVLAILTELVARQPRAPGAGLTGDLEPALRLLVPLIQPGSLVLALTDFSGLNDPRGVAATEPLWRALAEHNECRLFQISDPLERCGLPAGRYRAGVPGNVATLDGAGVRAQWLASWQRREQHVAELALRLRAPVIALDTGEDVVRALSPAMRAGKFVA
jgi:uncharacterized protein (DUF58 family)